MKSMREIGIEKDNILGIKLEKNDCNYLIRYDIVLFDINIQEIENEINMINKSEIFIAI